MLGAVLVITSPGDAYSKMVNAWNFAWQRQRPDNIQLVFLAEHDQEPPNSISNEHIWLQAAACQSMVPGILNKTKQGFEFVQRKYPNAWIFRTNLSSYVHVDTIGLLMTNLQGKAALGYSPTYNHLSGAGFGISAEAIKAILSEWHALDDTLIDDLAISQWLISNCQIHWTGRIDMVHPDGLQMLGCPPFYHVRVKTKDRHSDADLLSSLAAYGMQLAHTWFLS